MKKILFSFCLASCAHSAFAQSTISNLWLFSLNKQGSAVKIEHALKLTDSPGYSNQPHFLSDGSGLYYTESFDNEKGGQTDAMYYELANNNHLNLTHSSLSEFSPTPLPDGNGFSTIRVDEAGKQWLWSFAANGDSQGKLSDAEPVGYHVWINSETFLAFILGEPHTLQAISLGGHRIVVDEHIGPSLWHIPATQLYSYTKNPAPEQQPWTLMAYDPKENSSQVLVTLPQGAYYMAWTNSAKALAAVGSELFAWTLSSTGESQPEKLTKDSSPESDTTQWESWLDLSDYCPKGVTRLHMSGDDHYLAAVCEE